MASSKAYYKIFAITVLLLSLTLISLAGNAEDTDVKECKTEYNPEIHHATTTKKHKRLKLKAIISISRRALAVGLASGAILETGVMLVLPDSFDYLTSELLPENPWKKFPFTTFIVMASDLFPFMFNLYAMSLYKKMTSDMDKQDEVNDDNTSQRRRNRYSLSSNL
ncbi:zinc transporter 7 [Arabidopsis lyrata subsp. lyrata]|uniref:zinc transporter 7 n=1 Tax=Arabidopsis lyrata subsp. lyrata TaxID=81972 RepID=UPI000A29E2E7|nr:zinc transporter 7 [Arabidopsis lyrata subsp. lyrata]|eukprot:XP_020880683.1 zinc transporter 7 [Arabidopsis lyrata subsp. lyrata]